MIKNDNFKMDNPKDKTDKNENFTTIILRVFACIVMTLGSFARRSAENNVR